MSNSFEKNFMQFEKNADSYEIKFENFGGNYYRIKAKGICFPSGYVITGVDLSVLIQRANKDNCDECRGDL